MAPWFSLACSFFSSVAFVHLPFSLHLARKERKRQLEALGKTRSIPKLGSPSRGQCFPSLRKLGRRPLVAGSKIADSQLSHSSSGKQTAGTVPGNLVSSLGRQTQGHRPLRQQNPSPKPKVTHCNNIFSPNRHSVPQHSN